MPAVAAFEVVGALWKLSWAVVAAPRPNSAGPGSSMYAFGGKLRRQAGLHFRRVGGAVAASCWAREFGQRRMSAVLG